MLNSLWKKELAVVIIGLFVTISFNLPISGNEYIDNHPPETPYFTPIPDYFYGVGYVGETMKVEFTTTDPDGDDVYYLIDWNDSSNTGWLGPYKSGEIGEATHIWENIRTYHLSIKAKDSYGAESNWSSKPYLFEIKPHIEIRIHRAFGIGATATVKNLGIKDYNLINWYFHFHRIKFKILPIIETKNGIIESLKAGETVIIKSGFMFRFALRSYLDFSLVLAEPDGSALGDQSRCIIIGPFVYTSGKPP